jgi:hypothetical protein
MKMLNFSTAKILTLKFKNGHISIFFLILVFITVKIKNGHTLQGNWYGITQ